MIYILEYKFSANLCKKRFILLPKLRLAGNLANVGDTEMHLLSWQEIVKEGDGWGRSRLAVNL
jgi:hypothetical protein